MKPNKNIIENIYSKRKVLQVSKWMIRYRIEDQEKNNDPIYFDDILEEFGNFKMDNDKDDATKNDVF